MVDTIRAGARSDTRSKIVDVAARQFGDKDGRLDAVAEHVMATFVSEQRAIDTL